MNIDMSDVPPGAEAAIRRFQNSLADVSTMAAELTRKADEPIEPFRGVDEAQLNQMARGPQASQDLIDCAAAIRRNECTWREVVEGHRRQPPEIIDLVSQGIPFAFATGRLAPPGAPSWSTQSPAPRSNPSLYEDDDEDNQMPDSWLE